MSRGHDMRQLLGQPGGFTVLEALVVLLSVVILLALVVWFGDYSRAL